MIRLDPSLYAWRTDLLFMGTFYVLSAVRRNCVPHKSRSKIHGIESQPRENGCMGVTTLDSQRNYPLVYACVFVCVSGPDIRHGSNRMLNMWDTVKSQHRDR